MGIACLLAVYCGCFHNKEQADKRISKKTPKNTKEYSTGTKHKWKTRRVRPRGKGQRTKTSREAES
jgi:hypothetical protein